MKASAFLFLNRNNIFIFKSSRTLAGEGEIVGEEHQQWRKEGNFKKKTAHLGSLQITVTLKFY